MQECLTDICKEFEKTKGFLTDKSDEKIALVNKLFVQFMECFHTIKEDKLLYPPGFTFDVTHYNEGNERMIRKYDDVDIRYILLSEFYDYSRLKKLYKRQK